MVQAPKSGQNQGQSGVFLWSANYTPSGPQINQPGFLHQPSLGVTRTANENHHLVQMERPHLMDGVHGYYLPLPCWGRAHRMSQKDFVLSPVLMKSDDVLSEYLQYFSSIVDCNAWDDAKAAAYLRPLLGVGSHWLDDVAEKDLKSFKAICSALGDQLNDINIVKLLLNKNHETEYIAYLEKVKKKEIKHKKKTELLSIESIVSIKFYPAAQISKYFPLHFLAAKKMTGSKKLLPVWQGPFTICGQLGPKTYIIEGDNSIKTTVNIDQLKKSQVKDKIGQLRRRGRPRKKNS
ncbi:hypothetical protein GQR58_016762 [Nymphon striatum]|nr:hypothetical protein GQR58_016762 [Nymphon striatum]